MTLYNSHDDIIICFVQANKNEDLVFSKDKKLFYGKLKSQYF